jgi:ribosomal protein S15P/S13E
VLLSNPRKQFSVVDLVCQVTKVPKEYVLGEGDAVSDEEALRNYRARYEELEEQLREAKDFNDLAAQEKAETERDKLLEHMCQDKGFHGKIRKQEGDRDKVRKAFLAAMRRVQKDIAQFDPPFAEHIKATLSCGWNPCYRPPADVLWST